MNDSDSDSFNLEVTLALVGALLGPVLLYIAGQMFRSSDNAYGLIDYFWSIPAGAITGYLMPQAWPDKKK